MKANRKSITPQTILTGAALLSLLLAGGCADDLLGVGQNRPPGEPQCVNPEDGATGVSVNTLLEWSCQDPDNDELTYEVFIAPDGGDWVQLDDAQISGETAELPEPLEFETLYHWYVRAYDPSGEMSEPAENWSFTTESETGSAPDTPSLIEPADGSTDVPLRPTFRWSATMNQPGPMLGVPPRPALSVPTPAGTTPSAATTATSATAVSVDADSAMTAAASDDGPSPASPADSYHLQVDDDDAFGSPEIDLSDLTDAEYRPDVQLPADTTLYWRVSASNAWGDSGWSDVWSFTTEPPDNYPPDEPSNPDPADGATGVSPGADLSWDCSDTDGDSLSFDVYWGEDGNPTYQTTLDEVYTWDPGLMDSGTTYEWYIVADDGTDTTEGPRWTFTTRDWSVETVDSSGTVGWSSSLALDGSDYPHIAYTADGTLKYAYWDGGAWQFETVDDSASVGWYISIQLDSSVHPHIAYFDNTNDDLKYTRWDGGAWQTETVDSGGLVGEYASLELDSSDYAHIAYFDTSNDDLKYARWDGSTWQIESVDTGGSVGEYASLELDSSDYAHIAYYDSSNYDLKYAYWDGGAWQTETVDSSGFIGKYPSLDLDSSDYAHIAYADANSDDLKYARWDGGAWQIETIATAGFLGWHNSLTVDSAGNAYVAYLDNSNENLRFAHNSGGSWQTELVDNAGYVGQTPSLRLDSLDAPHIAYYNQGDEDLKYAVK